ncbi:MAG TPA: hypothetical protein VNX26_00635 [Candidatus Acidoferrum sp.]|jgi:hypothetical protein|nr:hypothetical protein [Candidatus Acidoferrum sp.]
MFKTVCAVGLLLGIVALTVSRSAGTQNASPTYPVVVAKGKLVNQTAPIPTTIFFRPKQTGLYRLSVYATVTKTTPPTIQDNWFYNLYWSDDAGAEQNSGWELTWASDVGAPSAAAINSGLTTANVTTFEAVGGTSVSYSVTGAVDGSEFSLYYAVEQLQ